MIGVFFAAMPESGKPKCRLLRYRIQPLLERLLARGLLPPPPRRMDGEGVFASLSVPLRPISYLRAVAHAMLESQGPVVALATEIGFDDAKLELWG